MSDYLALLAQTERDAKLINALTREREELRAWIRADGDRTDTCTRHILDEVCINCRCGRAKS